MADVAVAPNGEELLNTLNANGQHQQASQQSVTTASPASNESQHSPPSVQTAQHQLPFPKLGDIRRPPTATNETSICYQFEDNDLPILIRYPIPPDQITLRDLKKALSIPLKSEYKFFFRSFDKDVGNVNEEIGDDDARLPIFHGKVVVVIQGNGEGSDHTSNSKLHHRRQRHNAYSSSAFTDGDSTTGTESMISSRRGGQYLGSHPHRNYGKSRARSHHHSSSYGYSESSIATSDRDSYVTSDDDETFQDEIDSDEDEDDYSSRISSTTEDTSVSRQRTYPRHHRHRNKPWEMSRTSSVSSFSEVHENVEAISVRLNLDVVSWLGISLVGPPQGGIYVNEIMKGGAVDLDGRIENNDKILQVNDIDIRSLTNDEAVQVIRDAAKKSQPIDLLILKTSSLNIKKHFTIPRSEPVRPIDPGAWVAHTEAARAKFMNHDNFPMTPSSLANTIDRMSLADSHQQFLQQTGQMPFVGTATYSTPGPGAPVGGGFASNSLPSSPLRRSMRANPQTSAVGGIGGAGMGQSQIPPGLALPIQLTADSDPELIVRTMAGPDSILDVRDRVWLKIRIPLAFIGADAVNWLHSWVQGFRDRKSAKKFASKLLKEGFIQHTVNSKKNFSDKCYYVFADEILAKVQQQLQNPLNIASSGVNYRMNEQFLQHSDLDSQRQPNFTSLTNEHLGVTSNGVKQQPGSYVMPFIKNWDETSEFHNYGYFGPDDGRGEDGSRVSGLREQFSDEQSTRSGQSVLFNPNAKTMTNTIGSNGSAGSRQTSNSAGKLVNGVANNNNILNHHYEDLQINPVTGNLMPVSPTASIPPQALTDHGSSVDDHHSGVGGPFHQSKPTFFSFQR